jgi:(S)-citramalyl-CoA lyase
MTSEWVGRSLLFVPATRPDRFEKAAASGADVVIVDLEDSVAAGDKEQARRNALAWACGLRTAGPRKAIRINSPRTLHGLRDLVVLLEGSAVPDYIVLPKTECAADLQQLASLLRQAGKPAQLIAIIESARAIAQVESIAESTQALAGLLFGSADLASDLRCANDWDSLHYARSRLVAAAAAADIAALDAPFFDLADVPALRQEIEVSARLGFTGKSAVHPSHIGPIHAGFSPTEEAVLHAQAVLQENEKGIGVVGGRMIDEAMARHARRVLSLAGLLRTI